ncbi:MAG: hypothetical protein HZC55_05035 [Verrucomicrobia bacterium]|nr:hypothetical protein [Verrucomicrobiota bacterium]
MAVGPLAVLPSPVWAVLPTSSSFTVTNGTATLSPSGNTVNINFSDKTILTWGTTTGTVAAPHRGIADGTSITNFIVDAGDTWNFASAGSILNKVVAGNNATNAGLAAGPAAAGIINGQLLGSNAKVYVLGNGGIVVGNGAQLNTQSLILSTLTEGSDGTFITLGDLLYNGASTGAITIGTITSGGNLRATAGTVSMAGGTIAGDLVLKSITSGSAIAMATGAATTVGGNLSITTTDGAVTQGANALTVGALTTGTQDVILSTGTASASLNNVGNDFERVLATTSGTGSVTIRDANIVTLGTSSIGGDLDVKVGGKTNTTGIATDGAVTVGGSVWLDTATSSNSAISFANNSAVGTAGTGGYLTAQTAGGNLTVNVVGNLTLGNVTTNATASQLVSAVNTNGAAWTAPTVTGSTVTAGAVTAVTVGGAGLNSPIYTGNLSLTISSPVASVTSPALAAGALPLGAVAVPVATQGSGYGAVPTVTIVGGGGTGATATATLTGDQVTGITITAGGSGYTTLPTIIIDPPVAGAAQAQARIVRDGTTGLLSTVEITNAGVGYGTLTTAMIGLPAISTANNFSAQGNISVTASGAISTAASGLSVNSANGIRSSANVATMNATAVTVGAPITVTGNNGVSIRSNAGDITVGGVITANRITANATGNITGNATGNITTNGRVQDTSSLLATGSITLDNTAYNLGTGNATVGQQLTINATNASIRSNNGITLFTSNVTGNLSLRAEPVAGGGTRAIFVGRNNGADAGSGIIVGGNLNLTTGGTGGITQNPDTKVEVFGALNLQTGWNNKDTTPANAYLAGGAIVLDAASVPGALTPSVRFGTINAHTGLATNPVSVSESTTLNLGNITASGLTAVSTAGSIVDSGVLTLGATGASFTVSGTNNVVLDTATNVVPVISVSGGKDNSFTALNANAKLESTNNSTGTTTIGTNSGFAVSIGNVVTTGDLVVNSGQYIDVVGNANITGNLSLTATGNVPTAGALGNLYAPAVTISNTTGRLTAITLSNSNALTYATAPTVTVTGGSLSPGSGSGTLATGTIVANAAGIITGVTVGVGGAGYTVAPTVTLPAVLAGGTAGSVTATVAGGVVTGFTVTNGGVGYVNGAAVTLTGGLSATTPATGVANLGAGGVIANITVTNNATNGGTLPYVSGNPITVDVTGPTTTAIAQSAGTLKVGGTTTVNLSGSAGNANLYRQNDFSNVVINSTTGGVLVNDVNTLTVSGVTPNNLTVTTGSAGGGAANAATAPVVEANPWNLVLGNLNVGSLNATASNAGGGNSGTITQASGSSIHSFGSTFFTTTNAAITIGNNGNNFGRIGVNTNAGASIGITIVEDGTMKIGNISARGTTNLTSRFGGIIEDPAADVVISNNGTLNATAANGSILIGNTTHTAGTTTANVVTFNASAPTGQVAVTSNNSTTLGNIAANSLTVEVNGGNGNITQSGWVRTFGSASFSASRNITLGNETNNFGRLFLATSNTSSNIAVTESGTLNLGRVTMPAASTGNFTATSVNGDVIDTGLGGVRPGGTIASPGTGLVTLAAAKGNVVLDDPTTDFPTTGGVVFSANNVTLSPLGGAALYLGSASGTATATGNLTVTSATGSIYNAGPVNVTGDAFFQSGSGDILMTNASNNFGTVKFAGRIVSITEAGHMSLVTGSSATGAATFTTAGGDITIVNRGGTVSLASTGLFNASGNITLPKLIQVSDTLTVSAAGTKDLSALSISGDLGNKAPQNFGTGTYLPPLP